MSIFNTIKFRFTAGVFFLIIVITAFLVALSYEHEKKAIEQRMYAQLNATADLKKELVVSYINERISGLKALSSARDMIESLSFMLNDKTSAFRAGHLMHIYQHLEAFQNTYPDYLSIEIADFNGNAIVSTVHHPHGSGKHTHKHEHKKGINRYIDIIKQGEAVVMQEYLDSKERHLDIALGIKDRSGNIKAVIVSSILLNNTLFPIFNDYTGLGVTGETLLIRLSGDSITYINPTRYPLRKKAVDVSYCKDYFRLCMNAVSGNEGIGEGFDYRERKIIGAYRYIPALGWGLVTKIDIDEAFKEITALRKRIFVFGTLILAITLAVSYFVVSMFISPVVSLTQKTKAITSGDYSIRIKSKRKDEIGDLERDFNDMVETLNNTKTEIESKQRELEEVNYDLERKVQERTAELRKANTTLSEALEDIKNSEEKFRQVINSSVDAVIISDDTKKILFFNKAAEDMFGYKKEDIIGREVEILIPEKYMERHRRGFETYVSNGKGTLLGRVVELYALKKGGKEFPVELSLSGWESKGKKYASAVIRDITQRKKTEEEIRKLSYAVEQSPVSIVITDTKGNITYVNRQFCKISGYSFEELMGKNPGILKSGETPPEEYKRLWQTITSGGMWTGVLHNKKKNGELFWESEIISPITNNEGVITNFIGIKEDITEKKKLEEMLFHSQKMEAIGQLAGGVAHDFNNILTAIIGFGGLMQMNLKEDDPNKTHLKEILTAAERATHLTHGLLAFSRKQIINPKAVNINAIIRNMEKLLKRIITEDIALKTVLADRDINIMADAGQIEQVLMNLTTNARDAMPHGGILTISAELVRLDDAFIKTHGYGEPREYALISVSDTGMGMDEETKNRIFEPFFTTKDFGKGTGLGLAIVYGIIKQHNGYINCYSEQDKGTTFRIYLPVISSGLAEIGATTAAKPKGGTETVLVADDDTSIRMLIKEVLQGFGYTVIEAADGNEAVSRFAENKDAVRLLLLDVVMPRKNGREAYEEIRAVMPDIKVIFMSGYTADIIHEKGIIEEGINFISKPVSPQAMLKTVREALDR